MKHQPLTGRRRSRGRLTVATNCVGLGCMALLQTLAVWVCLSTICCFHGATSSASPFPPTASASPVVGAISGDQLDDPPLAYVSPQNSLCANVTLAIYDKIETQLHFTPASAASGADLDASELALHAALNAEASLKEALVPEVVPALYSLALAKGIQSYRTVIDEVPTVTAAYCRLAELLLLANETVGSLQVLEELLLRWPDDPTALRLNANILSNRGQHALAAADGERLVSTGVATRTDFLQLAKDYFSMSQGSRAKIETATPNSAKDAPKRDLVLPGSSRDASTNSRPIVLTQDSRAHKSTADAFLAKSEEFFTAALVVSDTGAPGQGPSLQEAQEFRFYFFTSTTNQSAGGSSPKIAKRELEAAMAYAVVLMQRAKWAEAEAVVRLFCLACDSSIAL